MSDPHTLHPAALPMVTIQMREPACSNLDPEVTRLLNNHCWCLKSNKYAQLQPLSVRNQDQSCLRRYLGPVSRITTAAIDIKLSRPIWHRLFLPTQPVFSVTSTTSPRCPYPLRGARQLGLGGTGERVCGALQELRTQAWQHLTKCNFSDFCRL